jgi:hypothetical protein
MGKSVWIIRYESARSMAKMSIISLAQLPPY